MADISKITIPSGTYDIKDATARNEYAPKINGIYYGVCDTAQATKAKEVTLTNGTNFSLSTGAMVAIKFTYASAASTMTLNVNGTGAKNLRLYGTSAMSSGTTTNGWRAGAVVIFIYDGDGWIRSFWENSTYYHYTVYCSTAAATAAKVGTGGYTLEAGKYFILYNHVANTVQGAITLNINSKGAKPIYINGSASSASNYTMPQGYYLVHYNGTNYYLRTDDYIPGNIDGTANNVRGTVAVANGGTGVATTAAGKVFAGPASGSDAAPSFKSLATTSVGSASGWTANTPTAVTKKTVVTGGTTTDVPNISKKTVVTSATAAKATYADGILTISDGSVTTGDSVTVGTAIKAYTSLTTGDSVSVTAGTAAKLTVTSTTVATGSVT